MTRPVRSCEVDLADGDECGRRPAVAMARPGPLEPSYVCQRHRSEAEARGWTVLPPGRRPGGDASRTVQLHLRASPAEVAELEAAAGEQPLSAWIRDVALVAARR